MQEGISEEEAACAKIQKLERAFIWVIASLSVLQLLMGRASGQRHHLSLMSVPWLPSWELGTNMISWPEIPFLEEKWLETNIWWNQRYVIIREWTRIISFLLDENLHVLTQGDDSTITTTGSAIDAWCQVNPQRPALHSQLLGSLAGCVFPSCRLGSLKITFCDVACFHYCW